MAQRMGNLMEWDRLQGDEGDARFFPGRERMVALEVNAPSEVALWMHAPEDDEERFIALVKGRDRVEFSVPGNFSLFCTGGDLWYKTVDGDVIVNVEVAPVIFTRIANRKVRNHNLEMLEYQMRRNLEARMEQMAADAQQRLIDTENRYAASRRPLLAPIGPSGEESSAEGSEGQGKQPPETPARKGGKDEGEGGAGGKPAKSGKATAAAADD